MDFATKMKELAGKEKPEVADTNIAVEEKPTTVVDEKKSSKKEVVAEKVSKPSREELLAALSEELGEEVKDFNELKSRFGKQLTADEQRQLQEQESINEIKFAIDNKIATHDQIVEWQKIQQEDDDTLSYAEFVKSKKDNGSTQTQEQLKSEFSKYFFQSQIDEENDDEETINEKKKWNEIGNKEKALRAEQVRNRAKKNIEKIKKEYANYKDLARKSTEYVKTVADVINDYSNTFSFAVKDGDENIDMQIEVDGDVQQIVKDYLLQDGIGNQITASGKFGDKSYIRNVADTYIKTLPSYQSKRDEALIAKFRSIGVNEAKIGTTRQIQNKDGETVGKTTKSALVEKMSNLLKPKNNN